MKRVLLVSYYFPPLAGSGVFRPLRLAKCLPGAGWHVSVITVSANARVLRDETLSSEVPAETRVERTFSLEPRNVLLALGKVSLKGLARRSQPWLRVPDDQRGWVPFAVRGAMRVLESAAHDVVVSTSGPTSAHLVAREVHRRSGIPWVADFRDEWTTNPYLRYPSAWHLRLNRRLERAVLSEADRVVCVSTPWLDNLRALVPQEPESKFRVRPNGYDADHFPELPVGRADRFRIVYTGTFYGHRTPQVFLRPRSFSRPCDASSARDGFPETTSRSSSSDTPPAPKVSPTSPTAWFASSNNSPTSRPSGVLATRRRSYW
jgi:glycosyltransferase involved in cell wall biosynthesis